MNYPANVVSLHPYFKVHPGKMDAFTSSFSSFIDRTRAEDKNLYYEFTINGDIIFCREAYVGAAGALAHLASVGPLLVEMLKIADLVRLEVHGPADELDQMRAPLANFKPDWFILTAGLHH
jgi:quinol monooxygenase YgiN